MGAADKKLTRRNLRVKAFEIIYSKALQGPDTQADEILKSFNGAIAEIEKSFCRLVQFSNHVFEYSRIDANQEASKFLQKSKVDSSLAESKFIDILRSNESFIEAKKKFSLSDSFPDDLIRKAFKQLKESEQYLTYLESKESTKDVFLWVVQHCLDDHNLCAEYFRESFIQWEHNAEYIVKWSKLLLQNIEGFSFYDVLDKTQTQFVKQLVETHAGNKEYLSSLIKPKLNNWDAERVAVIDLLLLELGLTELLYFPDIPFKVSLNEYIDIAKMYSTKQSGQFVNGVLDNVRKELESQNALPKLAQNKSRE